MNMASTNDAKARVGDAVGEEKWILQHPVPEDILTQIGDITVSFATLELTLSMLVGSLIAEHQRIGQIITAELSFQGLRALLVSLYLERHGKDDDYETLRSLNVRAGELEAKRNQITHSIWGAGSAPGTVTRFKTTAKEKRGVHFDSKQMDITALKRIANEIKRVASEYQRFLVSLLENGKAINNPYKKAW